MLSGLIYDAWRGQRPPWLHFAMFLCHEATCYWNTDKRHSKPLLLHLIKSQDWLSEEKPVCCLWYQTKPTAYQTKKNVEQKPRTKLTLIQLLPYDIQLGKTIGSLTVHIKFRHCLRVYTCNACCFYHSCMLLATCKRLWSSFLFNKFDLILI